MRYSERCISQQNFVSCETTIRKADNTYMTIVKDFFKLRTFDVFTVTEWWHPNWDWLLILFKVSYIFTSILWDSRCLCTEFYTFCYRLAQIMTSQQERWGSGRRGRTCLDDWWQREMKHGVRWGQAFFPDSDPGQQKSDIHFQRIRSQTFKTQFITANWCGKYITPKYKLHKTRHWDVFHRMDSGKVALPQIRKETHT